MSAALIHITKKDIPAAALVYTHAFLTDPYTTYTLKDPEKRSPQLYDLMALFLRYSCRFGAVYATPGMEAVAAWMPPGSGRESSWRMIQAGVLPVMWRVGLATVRSSVQVESLAHKLHEHYAPQSHWYLSQLGVEPALQRQGFGQQVLTPTLERIDREGKAIYLETLNPKAIPFYGKLGFKVCEEVVLPDGGPPMWAMLRQSLPG